MNKYKLHILKSNLKEKGIKATLAEKILPFLFRPFLESVKKSTVLLNLFYNILPNIFRFSEETSIYKNSKSELVERMRCFWYSNVAGYFDLDGEKISRKDIFIYGGPNIEYSCPICQKSEWLSRVRQKNLFIEHSCSSPKECEIQCSKQGNDAWANLHQNFDFLLGCDKNLPAAKGIYVLFGKIDKFFAERLEPLERVFHRQFAYSCQLDLTESPDNINWQNYDFLFLYHPGLIRKFKRPSIPIVIFCHDFWPLENKDYQWVLDWLEPDIILTTYPYQWKKYFRLPQKTKVVFCPMFPSEFFTRSNLGKKDIDLLVIGNISGAIYLPRKKLNEQIYELKEKYKIEFSNLIGAFPPKKELGLYQVNPLGGHPLRYLNRWSEYLGSSKYVIFGRMKYGVLLGKYYEALGSGAIPIFPEVPDLKLLGIKPFKHYIPLSEVEGDNQKLSYFLNNYDKFNYIAENATKWYKENSDKMLFETFENLIREITGKKFPKRLL